MRTPRRKLPSHRPRNSAQGTGLLLANGATGRDRGTLLRIGSTSNENTRTYRWRGTRRAHARLRVNPVQGSGENRRQSRAAHRQVQGARTLEPHP